MDDFTRDRMESMLKDFKKLTILDQDDLIKEFDKMVTSVLTSTAMPTLEEGHVINGFSERRVYHKFKCTAIAHMNYERLSRNEIEKSKIPERQLCKYCAEIETIAQKSKPATDNRKK